MRNENNKFGKVISVVLIGIFITIAAVFLILFLTQRITGEAEDLATVFPPAYSIPSNSSQFSTKQTNQTPTSSLQETADPTISGSDTITSDKTLVPATYDVAALEAQMLDLVNQARSDAGLSAVEWDVFAASVATMHAEDMALNQYFSHWDMEGLGPDHRYALAGGSEVVMENIANHYEYWSDQTPKQIEDFEEVVSQAHEGLMNSPGHRANILDPDHTHVGIGFAYNPETGYFYVAQEFLNRYVTIDYLPDYGKKGQVISFSGSLLLDATDPLLNIAYEPFPSLMTNEMLDQTSTYSSAAEFQESYLPTILTDDTFTFEFQLGEDLGFYHIRIWVEKDGEMIPAVNDIVLVT